MSNTGRINRTLPPKLRSILFGNNSDEAVDRDIRLIADIDRAHILMLVHVGLMEIESARTLLDAIEDLESSGFKSLRGEESSRGIYLLWENHLSQLLGDRVGGSVHLGRSRNDMNATMLRMRLRKQYLELIREGIRLNRCLIQKSYAGRNMLAVGYTHFRPAMPLTVGHQMAAWSTALSRDIKGLIDSGEDLGRCPMGAGALAGTSLPIDPTFVAELLGFRQSASNSLDAVASRDVVLRLLASAAVMAVTVSRFATDLQHWALDEVGFVSLPDELVGSSSQMPQKRNPYLLEHVASRAMSAVGAFATASARMHATPFSNSVAVGTEAIRGTSEALNDVGETLCILRHVIAGVEFQPMPIGKVADASFINATVLSERLVVQRNISFREAHHLVGEMTNEAIKTNCSLSELVASRCHIDVSDVDPTSIALAGHFGGGPSIKSVENQLGFLKMSHKEFCQYFRDEQRSLTAARTKLLELTHSL